MKEFKVIHIKDITGFEVRKNGAVSGQLSRAVAGEFLFGGVGALVGAFSAKEKIKELSFIFKMNNFENPVIEINLIDGKTKKGSLIEKAAQSNITTITSLLEHLDNKYKNSQH